MTRALTVLAVLAQGADLVTWLVFQPVELNPLVRAHPPLAIAGKLAVLVAMACLAPATVGPLAGDRLILNRRLVRGTLMAAIIAGVVGAWSNQ